MEKLIVTGATSMLGAALTETALRAGAEVWGVIRPDTDRRCRLPVSQRLHLVEADLQRLPDAPGLPADADVFYHFAWAHTGKATRNDPELQAENIRFTLDAVRLAHRLGCRTFVGAGSQAEYGRVDGVIGADTPLAPQTAYGTAKYAAGLLSRTLCDRLGMVHIWGRIFSVYGKNDNRDTMIDYAIRRFLRREPAFFSAGTQAWDYLFEADAGRIFYLLRAVGESQTYRIASGHARPLRAFAEALARCMDAEALCRFEAPGDRPPLGLQADISDLTAAIGYAPETDFETGIQSVVDAYRRAEAALS